MEGLNGRLQAIELGMAKLPEHFNAFKAQNKEQKREHAEQTGQIETLQQSMSALVLTATECQSRAKELNSCATMLEAWSIVE